MKDIKTSERTEDSKSPTIEYKQSKEQIKDQKAFYKRTLNNAGLGNNLYIIPI